MSINGWTATELTKSIGNARLTIWSHGGLWSGRVVEVRGIAFEVVAENIRGFATPGEAMDWAETTALILVAP